MLPQVIEDQLGARRRTEHVGHDVAPAIDFALLIRAAGVVCAIELVLPGQGLAKATRDLFLGQVYSVPSAGLGVGRGHARFGSDERADGVEEDGAKRMTNAT